MEKYFRLKEHGTTAGTEVVAGLTTFFTMAYIIFVNPAILSQTGMSKDGVFVATILASVIGTLVMGLFANVPYALAPGMGLNAFFTYTVCFGMGFKWQEALALVFICGIINIIVTVTKVRKIIIRSIPESLQNAIGGGIGLFIAYIGIKDAGFLSFTADPNTYVVNNGTVITDSSIVPALATFSKPAVILALIGLILTIVLLVLKVRGSIFISIIATTIIGMFIGVVDVSSVKWFDMSSVSHVNETAFKFFGSDGLGSMFATPDKLILSIVTIFAFSLSDTFDTIGTFIGTGRISGIFDAKDEEALENGKGFNSKMDKALFADSIATSIGALLGTSNTTTYVESSAGIAAGGRTGLTSVVTAILFILCLPFAGAFGIVPAAATAPALIVVGIMMAASFVNIKWNEFTEAAPAFMTVIIMAFAYNISYGIAAGFIVYCLVKIFKGEAKKVHPIIYGASVLFIINFIILAIRALQK
ncbi:MAG: NCS2 family permease [Bacillota bacterium]|nr:NCS2 family permease [Bacillota bacterium]